MVFGGILTNGNRWFARVVFLETRLLTHLRQEVLREDLIDYAPQRFETELTKAVQAIRPRESEDSTSLICVFMLPGLADFPARHSRCESLQTPNRMLWPGEIYEFLPTMGMA